MCCRGRDALPCVKSTLFMFDIESIYGGSRSTFFKICRKLSYHAGGAVLLIDCTLWRAFIPRRPFLMHVCYPSSSCVLQGRRARQDLHPPRPCQCPRHRPPPRRPSSLLAPPPPPPPHRPPYRLPPPPLLPRHRRGRASLTVPAVLTAARTAISVSARISSLPLPRRL